METATSEFLLIFHEKPERYYELSMEERRQAMDRWNAWCDELVASGRVKQGNTLGPVGRLVSGTPRGAGARHDGPFTEAKEWIGGYMLKAASLDERRRSPRRARTSWYGMVVGSVRSPRPAPSPVRSGGRRRGRRRCRPERRRYFRGNAPRRRGVGLGT